MLVCPNRVCTSFTSAPFSISSVACVCLNESIRLNEATIKKYIQDQEKYDIMQDKLSVKEYEDPFKG